MGERKKKGRRKLVRRMKKKAVKRENREGEKAQNKTVRVKRRCDGLVSVEAFEMFSRGRDLESCGGLSWGDLLEKPETCLILSLIFVRKCVWCLV